MRTNKVYFVLTTKCNKSCDFCYMRYNNVSTSDINTIKSIIDTIDHLIIIGGEPLLEKDRIFHILDMCKSVNEITITTNGSYLTRDFMNKVSYYTNTFIQVSIYDYMTAFKISSILSDDDTRVIIHYVLSDNNIDIFRQTHKMFNKHKIWISLDREISHDISCDIIELIDSGDITTNMFRDNKTVGKNCKVFSNRNIVINGNNIVKDCLNRQSKGSKMIINNNCLKCDNTLCDACLCDDIVLNRDVTCSIFKNIATKFKFMGEL